jgi:hypothetical protein
MIHLLAAPSISSTSISVLLTVLARAAAKQAARETTKQASKHLGEPVARVLCRCVELKMMPDGWLARWLAAQATRVRHYRQQQQQQQQREARTHCSA